MDSALTWPQGHKTCLQHKTTDHAKRIIVYIYIYIKHWNPLLPCSGVQSTVLIKLAMFQCILWHVQAEKSNSSTEHNLTTCTLVVCMCTYRRRRGSRSIYKTQAAIKEMCGEGDKKKLKWGCQKMVNAKVWFDWLGSLGHAAISPRVGMPAFSDPAISVVFEDLEAEPVKPVLHMQQEGKCEWR